MTITRATIAGLVATTFVSANASAQTTSTDIHAWPSVLVSAPVGDRLEVRAEGLLQITDGVSRVGRQLLRIVLVGHLNEHLALGGGYTWTRVEDRAGNVAVEHRAVQQLELGTPISLGTSVISTRTRLEERWREQEIGMALWLRQQARLDVSLRGRGLRIVVWGEYFQSLNTTGWWERTGPALMLSFAGLRVPLTKRTTLEPGYLNQTNFVSGRNQVRHVVALFFATRL